MEKSSQSDAHHTCSDRRWCRESYQGTPSGVPQAANEKEPALAAAVAIPIRNSDPSRAVAGARTFFVTSSIAVKRNLLQSDRSAELFVRVLYDYRAQGRFRLHELVVMPDHFHLLLTVGCELTVERAMQFIKGGFAFRAGRELGFRAPVWQKGFSEVRILDSVAYQRVVEYIRNNPVARHLVCEAPEFLYSSAHAGFELDVPPQGLKPVPRGVADGMAKAMP
jgi:REP-associated tyrosine transposase